MSFFVVALSLSSISSTVTFWDLVADVLITLVSAIAVYYVGVKKGWFDDKTPDKLI